MAKFEYRYVPLPRVWPGKQRPPGHVRPRSPFKVVTWRPIEALLAAHFVPVVSPLGRHAETGQGLNVNGDDAAAAIFVVASLLEHVRVGVDREGRLLMPEHRRDRDRVLLHPDDRVARKRVPQCVR